MGLLSLEMWGLGRTGLGDGRVHHGCIECEHPLRGDVDGQWTLSLEHKRTPGCRQVCGYHWGMGRIGVLRVDQAFLREEAPGSSPEQQGRDGAVVGPWRGPGKRGELGSLRSSHEEGVPAGSDAAGSGRRAENEM